jgi:sporulation protein YlmC with PRC-barrel domain
MKRTGTLALGTLCCFVLAATLSAAEEAKPADKDTFLYKASTIRGMKVYRDPALKEELGKISDVVINAKDGSIVYAALSYGGVAGVGDKLFAVPWNAMKMDANDKTTWLILNMDKAKLEAAQGFNQDRWPTEPDKMFGDIQKPGEGAAEAAARETKDKIKETAGEVKDAVRGPAEIQRVSAITGTNVKNGAGEDLGKISDLVFNPKDGKLAYAVLSYGGVAGVGSKYFAVPWNALKLDSATLKPNERTFLLEVPKSTLEQAQGFNNDNWPREPDTKLFAKKS